MLTACCARLLLPLATAAHAICFSLLRRCFFILHESCNKNVTSKGQPVCCKGGVPSLRGPSLLRFSCGVASLIRPSAQNPLWPLTKGAEGIKPEQKLRTVARGEH